MYEKLTANFHRIRLVDVCIAYNTLEIKTNTTSDLLKSVQLFGFYEVKVRFG